VKKHTPSSAAWAIRVFLGASIAKNWNEFFDGAHKASAYNAALLVQEQASCDFRTAMNSVECAMPELFADYWENLNKTKAQ